MRRWRPFSNVRATLGAAQATMADANELMSLARRVLESLSQDAEGFVEEIEDGVNIEFHLDMKGLAELWVEYVEVVKKHPGTNFVHWFLMRSKDKSVRLPIMVRVIPREEED